MAAVGAGIVLGLVVSTGAWAQAVIQGVTVRVNPEKMSAYLDRIASLQGVMDRVGGGGKVQVWNATLAGPATGSTLVAVSFPSLAAYAETTTKTSADAEWQKLMGGLDGIRTVVAQSLLESRDGGGTAEGAASGSVLQGVLVRVKPGKLDAYLKGIEDLKKVQKRVAPSAGTRVWQSTLGGETTGTVAVGVTHPSLVAYAENIAKLQADPEWQKIINGFEEIRTIASQSLFVAP